MNLYLILAMLHRPGTYRACNVFAVADTEADAAALGLTILRTQEPGFDQYTVAQALQLTDGRAFARDAQGRKHYVTITLEAPDGD